MSALGFAQDVARAMRLIVEAPARYPVAEHGTRRFLLQRYPFTVFYRQAGSVLEVVALAHQKRRPGYWAGR
jgi:plasmid stabilization system protein ParE